MVYTRLFERQDDPGERYFQTKLLSAVLSYLAVFISLLFFILPMLWIVYTSFRNTDAVVFSGQILTEAANLTLENYNTVLSVTDFPRHFLNTVVIASVVTLLSLLCSIMAAYG